MDIEQKQMNEQDFLNLFNKRRQLEQLNRQSKPLKGEVNELMHIVTDMMVQSRVRYVSETPNDNGPYWVLHKHPKPGKWTQERYVEFFTMLNNRSQSEPMSPQFMAQLAEQFLRKFDKRDVKLERMTRKPANASFEELELWLNGHDEMLSV